jgi:dihydropteroate synthase
MFSDSSQAVKRCARLEAEGSDIIDIGGESTRPGAAEVTVDEEIARTVPVIQAAVENVRIPISIDTRKAAVADAALQAGASMVNDISALGDPEMAAVAAGHGASVVLMHMQGTPKTMQKAPRYGDVVSEIKAFLESRISYATENGIRERRIVVDPGIGFGKTLEHNLEILDRLHEFMELGAPLLVGPSRKSFIGALTGADVAIRLPGTIAAVVTSILKGAGIVRVHDVPEIRQAVDIADAIVYGHGTP